MQKAANDNSKIIAIVNQKGGVGKTTTAVNLATGLAATSKKVLLIDLDPQGNASTGLGIEINQRQNNIYQAFFDKVNIKKTISQTKIPNLHIITATVDLSAAEIELSAVMSREYVLKTKVEEIQSAYDYILIDCPPSLGLLTLNALVCANSIIIPLQCEFYALEGFAHLTNTIKLVKKRLNPDLKINGIVLTMHDRRNKLSQQIEAEVRQLLGQDVFNTKIPRNIKIAQAPSFGQPAIIYDYKCQGSVAYMHLAKEIISREKIEENQAS